jgi:hypothetical protein
MVYHIQNYGVFGLLPSSSILWTRKHDVSVTGFVSVLTPEEGNGSFPKRLVF